MLQSVLEYSKGEPQGVGPTAFRACGPQGFGGTGVTGPVTSLVHPPFNGPSSLSYRTRRGFSPPGSEHKTAEWLEMRVLNERQPPIHES